MQSSPLTWLLALVLTTTAAAQTASQPSTQDSAASAGRLLKFIPADADLVLIVGNIDAISSGIAGFGAAIGLSDLARLDAAQLIREPLGQAGDTLRAGTPLVLFQFADHMETVVIAEVDPNRLPPSTGGATKGGTLHDLGDAGVVLVVDGDVGIIARDEPTARRSLTVGGDFNKILEDAGRKLLRHDQAVLYIDVSAWRETITTWIEFIAHTSMIGAASAGPDAADAMRVQRWFFDQLVELLGDGRSYLVGMSLSADGIDASDVLRVRREGPVGKYLAGVIKSDKPLLRGLRYNGRPSAVFGIEWSLKEGVKSVEENMLNVVLATDEFRERVGAERAADALVLWRAAQKRIAGVSGVWDWDADGSGLTISGLYLTREPSEYRDAIHRLFDRCPQFLSEWGSFPSSAVEYRREEVAGAPACVYQFQLSAESRPAVEAVMQLYGEAPTLMLASTDEGATYYMGPKSRAHSTTEKLINKQGTPFTEDPRVAALLSRFSAQPQAVLLFDMPQTMNGVLEMSRRMGVPGLKLTIGDAPTPLAGYALYLEDATVRQEIHIPAKALETTIEAFKRLDPQAFESE